MRRPQTVQIFEKLCGARTLQTEQSLLCSREHHTASNRKALTRSLAYPLTHQAARHLPVASRARLPVASRARADIVGGHNLTCTHTHTHGHTNRGAVTRGVRSPPLTPRSPHAYAAHRLVHFNGHPTHLPSSTQREDLVLRLTKLKHCRHSAIIDAPTRGGGRRTQ